MSGAAVSNTTPTEERWVRIGAEPFERSGPAGGFWRGSWQSVKDVWERRELVWLLSRREVRARYKDSSLGMVWSLARPLAQLVVYYFAIGKVLGVSRAIPSFAIFVFVGLMGWTLLIEVVQKGTSSILSNAGLVKKVKLPREVFPLSAGGSAMFMFVVQCAILVVAVVAFGEIPAWSGLGYAAIGIAVIIILSYAFALLLAGLNVYFRDIEHLVEVAFVVLFWASPIVYSFRFVDEFVGGTWIEQAYLANPVTVAIMGMQRGLWAPGGTESDLVVWPGDLAVRLGFSLVGSLILLWLSQRVFARLQANFAQEI
jgi:ABC-2 type transport system permease protein